MSTREKDIPSPSPGSPEVPQVLLRPLQGSASNSSLGVGKHPDTVGASGHRRRGKREGSIYRRRDGRWTASLSVGHVNGRRNRPTVYGRTRAEVQVKLNRLQIELHRGGFGTACSTRLADYLDSWLDADVTRDTSHDLYSRIKRLHIDPYIGTMLLAKVTPMAIQQFLSVLKRNHVTPSIRKHVYDTLRWALSRAVLDGLLASNPMGCVKAPKVERLPMRCLNQEQLRRFLSVARDDRYYALYVLASYGLRQGELFGLTDDDVDWVHGELHVRQSLHLVRGMRSLGQLKTSSSERTLKLAPLALIAIREHLTRLLAAGWPPERRKFPLADGRTAPLMFVNKMGQPLHRAAVRQHSFKKILRRAELPDIRFHDLRHTAASLMLQKGFGIMAVSKWLGHAKPSTTLNIYAKLLVDDRGKMAEELDQLLPP